jgi:hypothetical protein
LASGLSRWCQKWCFFAMIVINYSFLYSILTSGVTIVKVAALSRKMNIDVLRRLKE